MNNAINNLISIIRSNASEAAKLANQLCRIPGIDIDSVKVWNAPTREELSPSTSVRFDAIHAEFNWHDAIIKIDEDFNGKLIVIYNNQKIGEIYWPATYARLQWVTEITHNNNKAEDYILETIWKIVYRLSVKGKPYKKFALPKGIDFDGFHIRAEGACIVAYKNDEKFRVCGNTWRGNTWTTCDTHLNDVVGLMKRAFMK